MISRATLALACRQARGHASASTCMSICTCFHMHMSACIHTQPHVHMHMCPCAHAYMRSGANKLEIVQAGGVPALVAMLHSGSPEAQTHAAGIRVCIDTCICLHGGHVVRGAVAPGGPGDEQEDHHSLTDHRHSFPHPAPSPTHLHPSPMLSGALWHLAALETNKKIITRSGAITPLVHLLSSPTEAHRRVCMYMGWHMHACVRVCMHAPHACSRIHPYACMLTHICICMHACSRIHPYVCIHACIHMAVLTSLHAYACMHMGVLSSHWSRPHRIGRATPRPT